MKIQLKWPQEGRTEYMSHFFFKVFAPAHATHQSGVAKTAASDAPGPAPGESSAVLVAKIGARSDQNRSQKRLGRCFFAWSDAGTIF